MMKPSDSVFAFLLIWAAFILLKIKGVITTHWAVILMMPIWAPSATALALILLSMSIGIFIFMWLFAKRVLGW